MEFYSVNPYNGKQVGKYTAQSSEETKKVLDQSGEVFKDWSKQPLSYRTELLQKAARY